MSVDTIRAAYEALADGEAEPLVSLIDPANGLARATTPVALLAPPPS